MKNLVLLIVGLGLLFFFFKPQKKSSEPSSSAPSQKLSARASQEPKLKVEDPVETPGPTLKEETQAIKAAGLARQAGFRNLPIKQVNGHWELPIKFTATHKHCEMGDLDLIRIDQKRRGVRSLILALDDMSSRENVVYQKLNVEQLVGQSLTLRWKASEELRPLGLYICSDVNERQSCHAARVGDVNQALKPKEPRREIDKVYYFQFIQEGPRLALLDSSRQLAKNPKVLGRALAAVGIPSGEARKLAENVSQHHVGIGSKSARFEDKQLTIDLPQNDPACPLPHLKF